MKKIIKLLIWLLLFSCTKEVVIDVPPQLEIRVKNLFNESIEGADVTLFLLKKDWEKNSNPILQGTTDLEGSVLFEDLDTLDYFFFVKKSNFNNLNQISSVGEALERNTKKIVVTTIE